MADLISDGEAAKVRNWGDLRSRSRPEAESVSLVVGLAWRTGLKTSFSQPVIGG